MSRVAASLRGDHGTTYGPRPVLIDFWVQDLGGIPLVVETWHEDNAPSRTVDQIARTQKSVTFVTGTQPRGERGHDVSRRLRTRSDPPRLTVRDGSLCDA